MYSLNRIKLIGYLTNTPELKSLPSGSNVCNINLQVVSKIQKEGGEVINGTSFHDVTFFGYSADNISKYTSVGSQVYVEGRLKTESWDSPEGKKKYKTKVIADDMLLLTPQNGGFPAIKSTVFGTGLNNVEIIGNITKDLEVRKTPNGHTVGSTSIASNRKWKDKVNSEMKEETEYHNIVLWGTLAEEGETLLKKGRKVFISGRVQTRSWDSPEGEKKYTTEIIAEKISLLGSESPIDISSSNSSTGNVIASGSASSESFSDDIPEVPSIQYEASIKPEDLPF